MAGVSASLEQPQDYVAPARALAPHIEALRLTHFRSHENLTLDCAPRAMVLLGANGIGKTNVLEALSMLAPGRGLRGAAFDDMRFERRLGWTVSSDIATPDGLVRAGIGWRDGARRVRIDGANGKMDDMAHMLPQLWLTPQWTACLSMGRVGGANFSIALRKALMPA